MKFLFYLLIGACLCGCSSGSKDLSSEITGNWLIIFPDHQLKTLKEREVYGKYQDSIVGLYGLKLVSFSENGAFLEVDSIYKQPGKWQLGTNNRLVIQEGGKGFNPFKTKVQKIEKDSMQLSQDISLEEETIRIVWYLKKIDEDNKAGILFSPDANKWRIRPSAPESDDAIRKRIINVLNYYSEYFTLIGKEASYFSAKRIPLPFYYYQHAVGMKEMTPAFIRLFYDENDASKGYGMLMKTVNSLLNKFKWGENFAVEYSMAFKKIALYLSN